LRAVTSTTSAPWAPTDIGGMPGGRRTHAEQGDGDGGPNVSRDGRPRQGRWPIPCIRLLGPSHAAMRREERMSQFKSGWVVGLALSLGVAIAPACVEEECLVACLHLLELDLELPAGATATSVTGTVTYEGI